MNIVFSSSVHINIYTWIKSDNQISTSLFF